MNYIAVVIVQRKRERIAFTQLYSHKITLVIVNN